MATMPAAHQNFISNTSQECKTLLDLTGMLNQLNTLWAGPPGYSTLITQDEINSVPAFAESGLTVKDLSDAEYALAQLLIGINNSIVAFTVLANLP